MCRPPQQAAAVAPAEQYVEVDGDDVDSAIGDDISSTSTSLRSSILKYEWKHGRRYHGYQAGAYIFPNDEREQERLDIVHHAFYRALDDRHFLAPINLNGLSVLDVGTGTGIWAIEVADLYPGATVTGSDLSPIQPSLVPVNVKFLVNDVELDWCEPAKYDFIHCRYMAGSIRDWARLVRQMYENLKPGGWVEFQDFVNTPYSEDGTLTSGSALVQLIDGLKVASDKVGRTTDPAPSFKPWAEAAGFVGVEERLFKLPVGTWPKDPKFKEMGVLIAASFCKGVDGITAVPFRDVLRWPQEEVDALNADVRQMVRRSDIHSILDFLVVTGTKPLTGH